VVGDHRDAVASSLPMFMRGACPKLTFRAML
jgi:hypothetical protein